ncbi:hypothetical protein GC425_08110 [Corynebacterium sp. zg254]|uniref:LytR C-terminal domain-containing protein n=1 Tax=Corynebacterium sp. zg254 TaxID=2656645 RepID=UPI002150AE06|nr:LytR C-terminal domain-containing protein [Corynebacterium sp. zg254]MCR5914812.1 hypothetical protein [Corynebacterium sp. zg254]
MSENYRPRHSLDSRYSNYDADFDLFEDRVVEPYSSSDASSADPAPSSEAGAAAKADPAPERNPYLDEPEESYGAHADTPEDGILDADFEPIDEPHDEDADQRATSRAATGLGAGAGLSAAAVAVDRRPLNLAKDSGAGVEEAGVGETGAAAAAGGATDEDVFGNGGQPADPDTKGVPLRGLVMILAAVGILLIGWGSYMLLSGDDKQETVASENNAGDHGEQHAPGGNAGAADRPGGNGAEKPGAEAGRPGEENKPGDNREGRDGRDDRDNPEANRDEKPDNAPAGQIDPEREYIAVLNNSQVSGLAGDVAKKIRGGEFKSTGYGNLPTGRFPESVVLYPSNNQPAREAAEKLARDLGIAAQERTPEIDDNLAGAEMFEGGKPAQIVVVTTNSMPQ